MRIAQVAPLYESVPPANYGGTGRIVSYLTEELVKRGHEVTLFASGDSKTSATLVSHVEEALLGGDVKDPLAHHIAQMQDVMERADQYDILHFHTDYLHFPFSSLLNQPKLTTLHSRQDIPDLVYVYHKFKQQPLVSISDAQRELMPVDVNWIGTVHHGIPADLYRLGDGSGEYVAFIGRISPETRPDRAISIAKEAGIKIKIAAKIDQADQTYYETMISKLMDQPHVEFIGEIGEEEKQGFLGNAKALLFPIDWPDPFGISMIESMACGTPVIGYDHGSIAEVIDNGKSGFIVDSIENAACAVEKASQVNRQQVREIFQQRFSAEIMAEKYVQLYRALSTKKKGIYMAPVLNKPVRAVS